MKKRTPIAAITVTAAFVILIGICMWSSFGYGSTYYYTKIDNTCVKQVDPRGGVIDFRGQMPYSYTLPSYSKSGNEKNITFGTSRELAEGAFLRLTVMPIRGVTAWEEVQFGELPAAVQSCYPAPDHT